VDLFLIPREPFRHAGAQFGPRRTPECEVRGYCGPFVNEALYDAFPEPLWHGMGDCLECGTTCHVPRELQRSEQKRVASVA
jgi:hypothetical protein